MADSYLLTVEKALTDLISNEVTAVGGRVYRGLSMPGRTDNLPMISIIQAADVDDMLMETDNGIKRTDWKTYLINGWTTEEDFTAPVDGAHDLLAATKQALGQILGNMDSPNYMLKSYNTTNPKRGLIADMIMSVGLVRPPEEVSTTPYFWLIVKVKLVEDALNPYALPS